MDRERKDVRTGGWDSSESSGNTGYARKSYANIARAERALERKPVMEQNRIRMVSVTSRVKTASHLFVVLLTDGFSATLSDWFETLFMELGASGGTLLHYLNPGDPGVIDDVMASIQSASLRRQQARDQKKYDSDIATMGGPAAYRRRESEKLAKLLRVEDAKRPCLVFFTASSRKRLVMSLPSHVLASEQGRSAFGRVLCSQLSEERLNTELGDLDINSEEGFAAVRKRLGELIKPLHDPHLVEQWADPGLTTQQVRDYAEHRYLTRHRIHLLGFREKAHWVQVDGKDLRFSPKPFALLVRLAASLKTDEKGWVHQNDLCKNGLVRIDQIAQAISRVRARFTPAGVDGLQMIEARPKMHRLSTHPDLVTYDKDTLLDDRDKLVRNMAKLLPWEEDDGPTEMRVLG